MFYERQTSMTTRWTTLAALLLWAAAAGAQTTLKLATMCADGSI
jgi:hypothetical protein